MHNWGRVPNWEKNLRKEQSIKLWWDENGWLCQNSWGTTWGHHGLFRLRYDYGLAEVFGIKDDESLDSDSTIVNPVYNSQLLECIFKIINKISNWVLGR